MKLKKQKPYLDPSSELLVIDGKKYIASYTKYKKIDGIEHQDKILLKEFDEEAHLRKIDYVFKKINKSVEKEMLLKQVLTKIDISALEKVYKDLKQADKEKKELKISQQEGCYGLKIGEKYLELID